MGTRALRYLTEPQPIEVETDAADTPIAITSNGRRYEVDCIREEWLIHDQWWTDAPVAQRCIDLVLVGGRQIDIRRQRSRWTTSSKISGR